MEEKETLEYGCINPSTVLNTPTCSDNKIHESPGIKKLPTPILYSMALIGCYEIGLSTQQKRSVKSVLSDMYRAFVMIIMLLHLARVGAAFVFLPQHDTYHNSLIFARLGSLILTYLVNLKATSSKYGLLEKAFIFWDQTINPEFFELGVRFPTPKLQKQLTFVTVASWLAVVVNLVTIGIQIKVYGPTFYATPFEGTPAIFVLALVLNFYASGLWAWPAGCTIMSNIVIHEAFWAFNKLNSKYCAKHGSNSSMDIQRMRVLYMNLCKLVKDFDHDICWYYACTFTFTIGLSVFQLYQIVETHLIPYELVVYIFWLSAQLSLMTLLAFHAASVNDAAHSPLDTIYYIDVKDITVEKLAQLNLFLSKLTGTQVGFTACGFLVITKEFILTIAGAFLTYFAVLYTL